MKVMTVRGAISPNELGITLPHEHLLIDATCYFVEPSAFSKMPLVDAPVTIEILGELRRNPTVSKDNLKLCDVEVAAAELMKYKMMGGRSLVDVTLPGIGRDHIALRRISEVTGVNVVCATGWFVDISHPAYIKQKSVDELSAIMMRELAESIDDTGIKAGIIKGACSDPLTPNERKVLQAAGRTQAKTGAPLTIHPALMNLETKRDNIKKANEHLDIIQKEGADLGKVYVSHMDLTCSDTEYHREIIDKYGVTLAYDNFGILNCDDSLYPGAFDMSDMQRVTALMEMLNSGYEKHLMISHDVWTKICLRKYGGYGYAHILEHIVPTLKHKGANEKQINTLLVENPKRILPY